MRKILTTYPCIEQDDIDAVCEQMKTTFITQGKRTREFEEAFAKQVGKRYAVALNSGTSANYLMLDILLRMKELQPGDEVLTTALTWVTSVAPIINLGLQPVFADVDEHFSMKFDKSLLTAKTKAVFAVHLLGIPTKNMFPADLIKIEDSCEAMGIAGSGYGKMASYSFFASHHITTGEGGMLVTDDVRYYELARKLREFGRMHPGAGGAKNFIFEYYGYNYKFTDIQASLGLSQLRKFPRFLAQRNENAKVLCSAFGRYKKHISVPEYTAESSWFAFPVTVRKDAPFRAKELKDHLEAHGVETRAIMAGNILEQECSRLLKCRKGDLTNTQHFAEEGFLISCGHAYRTEDMEYIQETLAAFMEAKGQ